MEKILVCKKVRLGQDGGNFKKNIIAATERKRILVNESEFNRGNENWENSGRLYILNKEATAARDEEVAARENPKEVKPTNEELVALKKIADEKGIQYAKNAGVKKLKELLEL